MHLIKLLERVKRQEEEREPFMFRKKEKELMEYLEHEAMYGPHFNEEFALCAAEEMINEDGSRGPQWPMEETIEIAKDCGIEVQTERYNEWDWFVTMNMMYSDYCRAISEIGAEKKNPKIYAHLAKAFLEDVDGPEGKVWKYFMFIVNGENLIEELLLEGEEGEENRYMFARGRGRRGGRGRGRRMREQGGGGMSAKDIFKFKGKYLHDDDGEEFEKYAPFMYAGSGGGGGSSSARGGSSRARGGSSNARGGSSAMGGGSYARGGGNSARGGGSYSMGEDVNDWRYEQEMEREREREERERMEQEMGERNRRTSIKYY